MQRVKTNKRVRGEYLQLCFYVLIFGYNIYTGLFITYEVYTMSIICKKNYIVACRPLAYLAMLFLLIFASKPHSPPKREAYEAD